MYLDAQKADDYRRDGYVVLENVFTPEQIAAMIAEIEGGGKVAENLRKRPDTAGKTANLALWYDIGDDIWGAASINPKIVNSVRVLVGEEVTFFHGKVMMKEAKTGGRWEWHQDYGYWYDQGFLYPRMMSAYVALDRATQENGCLKVLKGSHHVGRLNHEKVGGQTGIDPNRIAALEDMFELVYCEMGPGSVLFFDSNLLHSSGSNDSDYHRRAFIICFNALANPQLKGYSEHDLEPVPCPVGDGHEFDRYVMA